MAAKTPKEREKPAARTSAAKPKASTQKLLSGGNPQIAKGYGEEPVQAYIDAMPGWKSDVWRRFDKLITRTVPNVQKAVKYNSPLYGVEPDRWFLGVHCYANYIKVAFFKGANLTPAPPGPSKSADTRYLDIYEDDSIDEKQFVAWVKDASKLPGEKL